MIEWTVQNCDYGSEKSDCGGGGRGEITTINKIMGEGVPMNSNYWGWG